MTGDARIDAATKQMVLAFGIDNIIIDKSRPKDPAASRYLDNTALTRGKPAIAVEAGYAGTTESDDIELLANGCFNVMRSLQMLPGDAKPLDNPVWYESVQTVAGDVNGIFYPSVKRGEYVQQGAKLGRITDYTGRLLVEPRASAAGVILYVDALPTMTKGATVANIGVIARQSP
jgi:predicted deacylase